MAAFAQAKWTEAAAGLENLVASVKDPAGIVKLAPVVYTLGAAYFNAGEYGKAIESFKLYLSRYPQGEKAGEVRLAAAKAMFRTKDEAGAAKLFAQFDSIPNLRDDALLAQADCYRMASRTSDQIKVLEKLIGPVIRSKKQAQGGLMLAELYISEKATARALALLQNLSIHRDLVDNVIALNSLIVQLGDELASNKSYAEALAAYRQVKTREEVIGFQADRIATMNLEVTKTPSDPSNSGAIQEGKAQLEQAKTLLAEFSKMPDYWPAVLFRMASAYYEAGKRWEALVVFDRLLADYPDGTNTEAALFASVICSSELSRGERTLRREVDAKFFLAVASQVSVPLLIVTKITYS
jgi:TolA-binding protein